MEKLRLNKGIVSHFIADHRGRAMSGDNMGFFIKSVELLLDGLDNRFEITSWEIGTTN